MEQHAPGQRVIQGQGCLLVSVGMVLACILLVIGPTSYAVYRYRAAQVFSGDLVASNRPVKLPTQRADSYTLTLQPQVNAPGGVTLGFTLRDSFGRTLAANSDFYMTGCPPDSPANQTCPAQSRDFSFHNTLGGPVQIMLESTEPGIMIAVQIRDEDAGGIFASGSLVLFGAFFGCGSLLWIVSIALLIILARRLERRSARWLQPAAKEQKINPEQSANDETKAP